MMAGHHGGMQRQSMGMVDINNVCMQMEPPSTLQPENNRTRSTLLIALLAHKLCGTAEERHSKQQRRRSLLRC